MDNLDNLDRQIEQARGLSEALPFGDSMAKRLLFTNGEGPAQELRHHVLQLRLKLADIKRADFRRQRAEIELEALQARLFLLSDPSDPARRLLEIDLAEKAWELEEGEKYRSDALLEVAAHQAAIAALPAIASREDYERSEALSWATALLQKLADQQTAGGAVDPGLIESLRKLGLAVGRNAAGLFEVTPLPRLAELGLALTDFPLLTAPKEAPCPPLSPPL